MIMRVSRQHSRICSVASIPSNRLQWGNHLDLYTSGSETGGHKSSV